MPSTWTKGPSASAPKRIARPAQKRGIRHPVRHAMNMTIGATHVSDATFSK